MILFVYVKDVVWFEVLVWLFVWLLFDIVLVCSGMVVLLMV